MPAATNSSLWSTGWAMLWAAALSLFLSLAPSAAQAQSSGLGEAGATPPDGAESAVGDDVLLDLLAAARDGSGDPHLPFVLVRLKRALGEQDLIAFLDLVDPAYFAEQFGLLSGPDRSPGEAMAQFTCEFISVCDVAKSYKFTDVVSVKVISVGRLDTPLDQPVEVKIELQMWDGVYVPARIFYNRRSYRLSSGLG